MLALLVDLVLASLCGLGAGALLLVGNRAFDSGVIYLVILCVPTNLAAALTTYFAIRGSAAVAEAGVAFCVVVSFVNLIAALGVAAWSSGFLGSGGDTVGTHTFTWGMGFAYIEVIKDVHKGTWFGETPD